ERRRSYDLLWNWTGCRDSNRHTVYLECSGLESMQSRSPQNGFALILILIAILLFFFIGSALFILLFDNTAESLSTAGESSDQNSIGQSNSTSSNSSLPGSNVSNVPPILEEQGDVKLGELVCVNLPGIGYPRTPALDRKVALLLLRVRQDLDAQNVPALTFNWAFRTT